MKLTTISGVFLNFILASFCVPGIAADRQAVQNCEIVKAGANEMWKKKYLHDDAKFSNEESRLKDFIEVVKNRTNTIAEFLSKEAEKAEYNDCRSSNDPTTNQGCHATLVGKLRSFATSKSKNEFGNWFADPEDGVGPAFYGFKTNANMGYVNGSGFFVADFDQPLLIRLSLKTSPPTYEYRMPHNNGELTRFMPAQKFMRMLEENLQQIQQKRTRYPTKDEYVNSEIAKSHCVSKAETAEQKTENPAAPTEGQDNTAVPTAAD